eukprot:s176_g12.t1
MDPTHYPPNSRGHEAQLLAATPSLIAQLDLTPSGSHGDCNRGSCGCRRHDARCCHKGLAAYLVFEYNRDNFMEDREQRMKKEFHERKYRVVQGQLWRQDVRDFVSLTEQKMSLYLIINVLLLSFTVTMWVEGQLPETTPDWLVMGYQIASVVAFSYLVLTIWLAMHAAIAAQSYQTRVLTQLVRLPIPTWAELEAARTAGSEFEKVESRQMFRVPFVTGKQEDFVPGAQSGHAASDVDDVCPPEESGNTGGPEQVYAGVATDPWGLEQRGDGIYELGCYSGAEVANLRHVKLLRQAAVYWQTYDAFARVSMSVGINQLMLGMSYYILGYAMLEVKAPLAALAGVLAFMGSAEATEAVLICPCNEACAIRLRKLHKPSPLFYGSQQLCWCISADVNQSMATILRGRRLASRLLAQRSRIAPQVRTAVAAPFQYEELFDLHANEVPTQYRKLSSDGVSTCMLPSGEKLLKVESEVLESLSHQAIVDIQHLFRPSHLEMLSKILKESRSACCGDHRSSGPLVEVVTPLDLPGVLESINDGLGTVLHLLQQNCSDQLQLKNLAIVHQEMMLRQERCLQNLAEGLAISAPCTSMQKKDRDEENEDYDKVESVVHFQLDEVSDGAEGWMAPNQQALAIPHGDRECPTDEILLPVIQKGSSPAAKKMSSRDGPKFGQRFVTQGQESEPETVAFEIIGLLCAEMASSTALRRFFFHWVASAIEWCEDCREPHRTGILAKIVKSNRFGGLCMTVILLNSIVISYQSDFEMKNPGATTPYPLMMIELGFAFFYGIEILLKLVCLSLVEGINLTFLRLLRLCKIAKVLRVLRTLRFFRELRLMLDCVLGSVINAIWCVAMLFFVMFIFALLMVQGLADYLGQYSREFGPESLTEEFVGDIMLWYGSVGRTILTLFQSTTSGIDWRDCYLPLEQSSELVAGMFLVFVGLFTISVWNIVTPFPQLPSQAHGCSPFHSTKPQVDVCRESAEVGPARPGVLSDGAPPEGQPKLCQKSLDWESRKDVQDAQSLIDLFCSRLGCSETSSICHGQFKLLAGQHRFRAYLTARGIDIKNVEVFFRMLAAASGNAEVEIKVLANALVRMKGFATSIDLQTLTFETKMQLSKQARSVKEVGRHVRRIVFRRQLLEKRTADKDLPVEHKDDPKPTLLRKVMPPAASHKSALRPRCPPEP